MKSLLAIALALAFAAPPSRAAGEHPKEHPVPDAKAPAKPPAKPKKADPQAELMRSFVAAVEEHIEGSSEDGVFPVQDEDAGKTWELELVRIHKDKIARLGPDKFFACADFKESEGRSKVDLDFYVTRGDEGWSVDQVLVHKVNGKPRFTYDAKNRRVQAAAPGPASGKARKPRSPRPRLEPMGGLGGSEAPQSGGGEAQPEPPPERPAAGGEHPTGHEHPSGQEHPR